MSPAATSSIPTASPELIEKLRTTLLSETTPLAARYRALFALKHHAAQHPATTATQPCLAAIAEALYSPAATRSPLLKHELAYCLGQTGDETGEAAEVLERVLRDHAEDPMVRHEAAEALGALGGRDSLTVLKARRDDPEEQRVVKETCEIAVERIEWATKGEEGVEGSAFSSIDPAPPFASKAAEAPDIPTLKAQLLDPAVPLFQRYRAMFSLRDLASPPDRQTAVDAVLALAEGLKRPAPKAGTVKGEDDDPGSALFRHEVAFVFGQLSHPVSIPALFDALADKGEASMVRHEAAEALGSMGDEEGVEERLKGFAQDEEQVVADSVIVALDMAEFERSGEVEWAGVKA